MNAKDVKRLNTVIAQANTLMNTPASVNPAVTNGNVVEALIGDVGEVLARRPPKWLAELIERDEMARS